MRHLALVSLMLCIAVPVFGDQPASPTAPNTRGGDPKSARPDPRSNALLGALRKAEQANPYGKLFQVQEALKQAVAAKANESKPRVVCGMLIVPADPTIDPKMRITPPQDPNVEYKIRVLEPPVCNPAK